MRGILEIPSGAKLLNRIATVVAVCVVTLDAQAQTVPIAIVPRPVSVTSRIGSFNVTASTGIQTDSATGMLGRQLADYLRPATRFPLPLSVHTGDATRSNSIVLRRDSSLVRLGPEGYRLEVSPERVVISAPEQAGLFYGVQTLRQLLPPEIFRASHAPEVSWTVPAVLIEDYPRFKWRGAHLDVSRHFMTKEFVRKYIDLLALHKMNSFHWHLTDDQGWRLQIRKYPKLTEVGAWRRETLIGRYNSDPSKRVFDGKRHGGFYTQDEVREIVAYAKARFVNVVPEIEMPGHSQAAIAAYPFLGNTDRQLEVLTLWGVSDDILNPSEQTVAFMQDVLAEVIELFPSEFIHVGGDEAIKTQWRRSPRVQEQIRRLGLKNEEELQSWFIRQMDTFLSARGRRLIGWDEILEGGLAPNATVMSWRGTRGGIAAARMGHDVVMAPTSHTYFDYYQARPARTEPLAIGGFLPLDTVYSFEPVPSSLKPEFAKHILGAQSQVWTEYIKTPAHVEYMSFPRLSALAEVVWTPRARKNLDDFKRRLTPHLRRLKFLSVDYRPLKARE
ncbi:MAG: beta-N-acetylhexosaminidase [Gemmatimonadaceae bacterium]